MENILSVLLSIIWFFITSVILALPVLFFIKYGSIKTHIEGDSNIIRYILKGSENSPGCSDFLLQHGFTCPLTKEYMKTLKKSDPNKYDYLISKLNIIINRESFIRNNFANI